MTVRRVIVDHVLFVVADLGEIRGLYTAALAPLGHEELYDQDAAAASSGSGLSHV
jgi:hypothetical protein